MKKSKQIILVLIVVIFIFLFYRIFVFAIFFKQSKKFGNLEFSERASIQTDDKNFPEYLKSFYDKDNNDYRNIDKSYKIISSIDDIYDSEANKKLLLFAEPLFSKDIINFQNIVQVIKKRMDAPKKAVPPTIKESESFPSNPTILTIRESARYWYIISRLLEQKEDYEKSLYTSLAILYLSKDLKTNYINSSDMLTTVLSIAISNMGCYSIMTWASKPKPQCMDVSKEVAKDILELVKTEYPFSKSIEYSCFLVDDMLRNLESKGNTTYSRIRQSNDYKNLLDIAYKEPMKYYDKPLYEIKNEMKKLATKSFNLIIEPDFSNYFNWFLFNPDKLMATLIIALSLPNLEQAKFLYEVGLAKLEMAAIALVINSYYCENNKCPESMEELSKWFGSELPKDRLTNKPYVLDFKGKHVIYNENFNELKKVKENFYFDFSFK